MLNDLTHRLRALFRRKRTEAELDEELRFHFDRQVETYIDEGLSPREAYRRSVLDFGGMDQVKEECRQARGTALVETTFQDFRLGLRSWRRTPSFALTATLTLALTTGALTTSFSLAYSFFLRPLALADSDAIIEVTATRRQGTERGLVSFPDYLRFRDNVRSLEGLAAHYSTAPLFAVTGDRAQEINGAVVSSNFFPLLRIRPKLGRFFLPKEDQAPDRDAVAVLGHDLWRDWFGASPAALGSHLKLNGTDFTIVGVAPKSFRGLSLSAGQIYIPASMLRTGYRWCDAFTEDCTILQMIGRLAEGRNLEQAQSEIEALMPPRWRQAQGRDNSGVRVERPRGVHYGASQTRLVRLLMLSSGLLLLVSCGNLAGLLTARASARAHEIAVRSSLGASRLRLVRQMMTESLLLALAGGLLGTLISLGLTDALRSRFYSVDSEGHRLTYDFSLEPAVILVVLAISLAAGILFGLLPALRASRLALYEGFREKGRSSPRRAGLGNLLVAGQAAGAVALASVAILLMSSAGTALSGLNFDPSGVALMRLRPRLMGYSPAKAQRFLQEATSRLEALPGVESVSLWGHPGGALHGGRTTVGLPGSSDASGIELEAFSGEVGPRFFRTLRITVLRGREFGPADSMDSPPVAVVNEALARRFWARRDAVGSTLLLPSGPHQVVGLVRDLPLQGRGEPERPKVYTSFWQNPKAVDARVCIRVRSNAGGRLPDLTRVVHALDPDVPIAEVMPMTSHVEGLFRTLRLSATFIAFIGGLAVLLSGLGLYGTLSFSLSGRLREIGTRMALGADRNGIRKMVLGAGMKLVLAGIVLGAGLSQLGIRLVRHLLMGPAGGDFGLLLAAALLVAATGILASWLPARRAASLDPALTLRKE